MIGLSKLFKISLGFESHLLGIVKGNLICSVQDSRLKFTIVTQVYFGVEWAKFQLISVLGFSSSWTSIERAQNRLLLPVQN